MRVAFITPHDTHHIQLPIHTHLRADCGQIESFFPCSIPVYEYKTTGLQYCLLETKPLWEGQQEQPPTNLHILSEPRVECALRAKSRQLYDAYETYSSNQTLSLVNDNALCDGLITFPSLKLMPQSNQNLNTFKNCLVKHSLKLFPLQNMLAYLN